MDAVNFYADDNKLIEVLGLWLAIFSEGSGVNVPVFMSGGFIDRRRTFDEPCFRDFPATEKAKWLRAEDNV